MTRELTNVTNTFLARDAIVSFLLLEVAGYYYTDAPFDITVMGNTYEAQGNFLGASEVSENSEVQISSINLTFSALDSSTVGRFNTSSIINKDVTIHRAFFNQATNELISDSAGDTPILIFKGRIGAYRLEDARDTATVNLQIDSLFANFEKVTCRRTNLNNFQREFPTDFGMEFSHETLNDLKWGRK